MRLRHAKLVTVELKPGSIQVRLKQYALKLESRMGLVPIIQKFLRYNLLKECKSKYSTSEKGRWKQP